MGRHRKREMVCVAMGDWPGCGKTFAGTGSSPLCDDCRRLRRSAKQHDLYVAQTAKPKPAIEQPMTRRKVEAILEAPNEELGPAHGFASLGDKRKRGL